jgi:hypothetical protein
MARVHDYTGLCLARCSFKQTNNHIRSSSPLLLIAGPASPRRNYFRGSFTLSNHPSGAARNVADLLAFVSLLVLVQTNKQSTKSPPATTDPISLKPQAPTGLCLVARARSN